MVESDTQTVARELLDAKTALDWFDEAARQVRNDTATTELLHEANARAVALIQAEKFDAAAVVLENLTNADSETNSLYSKLRRFGQWPISNAQIVTGDNNTSTLAIDFGGEYENFKSHNALHNSIPEKLALTANYAAALIELGEWDRAEAMLATILTLPTAIDFPREAALAMGNLAAIRAGQGKLAEAADLLRDAIVRIDDCSGEHGPDRAPLLQSLAEVLGEMGQTEAARDAQAQADAVTRRHPTAAE